MVIKNPRSTRRNRWLCVAYAFPPILRSGTHRTLGFVRELDRSGWDATVLTVRTRGESVDESLNESVPHGTRVVRAPWIDPIDLLKRLDPRRVGVSSTGADGDVQREVLFAPVRSRSQTMLDWLTAWFKTPDSRIGWVIPGVVAGLEAIRRDKPGVIYSTSPYASAHLIALLLREMTRLPWVADFRDPWRGNPFTTSKTRVLDRWDCVLEAAVLNRAAHVICNTPTMAGALQLRTPFIADKCSTILNAFDRERCASIVPQRVVPQDETALVHAGQFYGPRSPMPWFRALRRVVQADPEAARRLRFVLLGSRTFEGRSLEALAQQSGVRDRVRIVGDKCHDAALSIMAGADALALAGATGPGAHLQVPHKLFESLALRRPIIAHVVEASPVRSILQAADAQFVACDPNNGDALTRALIDLARNGARDWRGTWKGVDQFDRSHAARKLVELFEQLSNPPEPARHERSSALRRWVSPASPSPTHTSASPFGGKTGQNQCEADRHFAEYCVPNDGS